MTPLIVRLPNHLGDACMSIAALDALARGGLRADAGGPAVDPVVVRSLSLAHRGADAAAAAITCAP